MFRLYMLFIIHCLLLPFKFLINLILKCMWKPSIKKEKMIDEIVSCTHFEEHMELEIGRVDLYELVNDADFIKFLSLLDVSLQDRTNRYWELLISYISDKGIIGRHPIGNVNRNSATTFSGDMLSGFMLAITTRIANKTIDPMTRHILVRLWERTTFEGTALKFKHPDPSNTDNSRGYIYSFLSTGVEIPQLLVWFRLGYLLSDDNRYQIWYNRFRKVSRPLMWLNIFDYNIFLGRVYWLNWFTYHSNLLNCVSGYILTGDVYYKKTAECIADRYGHWNLDVQAIMSRYFNRSLTEDQMTVFKIQLMDSMNKGSLKYPEEKKISFFSIKSLKMIKYADKYLNMKYLGHKYIHENNPIKDSDMEGKKRIIWNIDTVIPYSLLMKKRM